MHVSDIDDIDVSDEVTRSSAPKGAGGSRL